MGPRAWSLSVEIPISAPRPYCPPSEKRVEQLMKTFAESIFCVNWLAVWILLVTIASVCFEEYLLMWLIASSVDSTVLSATMRSKNSVL